MILKKTEVCLELKGLFRTQGDIISQAPGDFSVTIQEGLVNIQSTNLVLQLFNLLTSELDP